MKLALAQVEQMPPDRQLVFLVGAPRSGTTWLQLLLSRSPAVVTTQETHLYNLFLRSMIDQWNRIRDSGDRVGLNQLLTEQEFLDLLRSVSRFVFNKIARGKPGATVILEKTPNHVQCWRDILRIWPDAHFIHIIRDPRAVVASLCVASRSWASDWASPSVVKNCERWVSDVTSGRQIRSGTRNYQEVSFRELYSDGPNTLSRLFNGLGVPASSEECEQYLEECSLANLSAGKLENAPFELAKMHPESFRKGSIEGWRMELTSWEVAVIESLAGPLMKDLGFKPINRSQIFLILLELAQKLKAIKSVARLVLHSQ